jgi:outer membrane receptor protein involved in Fe transport
MKLALLLGVAVAPLAIAGAAVAQTAETGPATAVEEVIVTGQPQMRNRTDDVVPTLSYDLDYFQRFEPLTAGDALKRVPSVTFLSDVLESDGVRLRGLDPAYTQILINGEKVPRRLRLRAARRRLGFFVDRIPAELIDRIEIVRSASANRSGDAVAGAINIVLRDAYALDGGYRPRRRPACSTTKRHGRNLSAASGAARSAPAACWSAPTSRAAATPRTSSACAMTSRARRSTTARSRPTSATAPTIRSTPAMRPRWPAATWT